MLQVGVWRTGVKYGGGPGADKKGEGKEEGKKRAASEIHAPTVLASSAPQEM